MGYMSEGIIEIKLQVPALAKLGGVVRDAVYGIALRSGISIEDSEDVKLSVGEAYTNAVQYAYDGEAIDKVVDVKCAILEDCLEIIIEDHGRGFTEDDKPEANKVGIGLGLTFIESLMDNLEIDSVIGRGTKVIMKKNRSDLNEVI